MKKAILGLVTSLVIALGLVAASPTPASASWAQCPTGVSCLYGAVLGQSEPVLFPYSSYGNGSCYTLTLKPVGGYHSALGGYGSGKGFIIYSGSNCSGQLAYLLAGASWSSTSTTINSIRVG